ncbi:hypothetical protein DPEC_G00303360 [Dallia pectoralis]|uniref:Uncharacterized protein n=1 Tax=Dallia pectoralis TaxID=75939 RepID=A0ACC2FDA3_DALPE|nr:hypothetical protein DPEC_G00303360 [Dallia pectoralis]
MAERNQRCGGGGCEGKRQKKPWLGLGESRLLAVVSIRLSPVVRNLPRTPQRPPDKQERRCLLQRQGSLHPCNHFQLTGCTCLGISSHLLPDASSHPCKPPPGCYEVMMTAQQSTSCTGSKQHSHWLALLVI